jgi:hypothetical protein
MCCGIGVALAACFAIANAAAGEAKTVSGLIAAFTRVDSDHNTIEMTAEPDGRTKVVIRGDYYDGRPLLSALFAAFTANDPAISAFDIDIDLKVGTFAGFADEALHDVELRISGKGDALTAFALSGTLGVAELRGELRSGREGERQIYLVTGDAGAFFRFFNLYRRVEGGQGWIALELPSAKQAVATGVLEAHGFKIRGEQLLHPLVMAGATEPSPDEVAVVSRLRLDFKLFADRVAVNEGIVIGPLIGATTDGVVNFADDDVKLRGTMIPLFASDQNTLMPSTPRRPEGLFALSYQIWGRMSAPILRINPFGPLAPGLLRKLFVPDVDGK